MGGAWYRPANRRWGAPLAFFDTLWGLLLLFTAHTEHHLTRIFGVGADTTQASNPSQDEDLMNHSFRSEDGSTSLNNNSFDENDTMDPNDPTATTAMLDACIADLSRRRQAMAQQAKAAASAVAREAQGQSVGGEQQQQQQQNNRMTAAAMGGRAAAPNNHGMPPLPGSAQRGAAALSQHQGGGAGARGAGLEAYVGTAADSFAQAFVDRWASAHSKNDEAVKAAFRGGGSIPPSADEMALMKTMASSGVGGMSSGSDGVSRGDFPVDFHRQQSGNSIGNASNNYMDRRAGGGEASLGLGSANTTTPGSGATGGSVGGGGTTPGNKQWFVCEFCKSKAFMSRVELKEHECLCYANPGTSSAAAAASASSVISNPNITGGDTSAAAAVAAAQAQMRQSISRMSMTGQMMDPQSAMASSMRIGGFGMGQFPPSATPGSVGGDDRRSSMASINSVEGMHAFQSWQNGMGGGGAPGGNPMHMYRMGMMGDMSGSMGGMPNPYAGGGMILPKSGERGRAQNQRTKGDPVEPTPELIEASKGPFSELDEPLALALEEDKEWLTPIHCFVRRHCVEAFTAKEADIQTPSKGKRKPIIVGQVGIRCPHCKPDPTVVESTPAGELQRERGSVYYPTSLASIYNATMNLLQRHLHSCPKVPQKIMDRYRELKKDDARSGTSKKYWIESAKSMGFIDTIGGIRMSASAPPPPPAMTTSQNEVSEYRRGRAGSEELFENDVKKGDDGEEEKSGEDVDREGSSKDKDADKEKEEAAEAPPLVLPNDKNTATTFSFLLLSQMQPCVFTEADRLGKRKGLPTGFSGLACRHCFGGYGSGRFFPSSIKTLSDTSKTLNVLHNHMARCRKCPKDILAQLDKAREEHDDERAKMKFGSQKAFFGKIWSRLHDNRPYDPVVIRAANTKVNNERRNSNAAAQMQTMRMPHAMAMNGMGMMMPPGAPMGTMPSHEAMMMSAMGVGGYPNQMMRMGGMGGFGMPPPGAETGFPPQQPQNNKRNHQAMSINMKPSQEAQNEMRKRMNMNNM